ncbi:MAG: hydantoinase/oxoprolinase family protein [Bacillota bacterium]
MAYKIGIDVGGTFTDLLLVSDGQSRIYKVLSTPDDPSEGLLNGLQEMGQDLGCSLTQFLQEVKIIVHGTTVTTNAVLTYRGAKTALLTTKGLRDALEMRRGIREEQYNNRYTNVEPLVPRHLRFPVEERVDYKGEILTALKREDVHEAIKAVKRSEIEAIAVCFMNSFANKSHEEAAAQLLKSELPGVYLTISSHLLPSIRFYDRISTTVLNSYVGPILRRYLYSLMNKLEEAGFTGVLLIMQSNGGVVAPGIAAERASATLLSGPAGGPVAGVYYTSLHGFEHCLTVDMGGTSFDAALIKNKSPLVTSEGEINRLRIALPMLDIVTIGAGGGSIGWIDEGGLLRMGPQSAGAKPGPACYGRGGELPTCTDADLVLGYLDPDYFAGGKIRLNYDRAVKAIQEHVAAKLRLDVVEAAAGMYNLINVNMANGVREVTVKRGEDPRDFPLVVAGGAGPNHACMIALELEIPVVVIPRESSIFCAAGMLMSDLKHDFVRTYHTVLDQLDKERLRDLFAEMAREGLGMLKTEHIPENMVRYSYYLDMRYVKQYHEVNVEISAEELFADDLDSILAKFHHKHNTLYGYSLEKEGTPVELINVRLSCTGLTEKPKFLTYEYAGPDPSGAYKRHRQIYLPAQKTFREVPVFDGDRLRCGNLIAGPAIIEQINTTTLITPEYTCLVDRYNSFVLFLNEKRDEYVGRILL